MADIGDVQKIREMHAVCKELLKSNDFLIKLSIQRLNDILTDLLLEIDPDGPALLKAKQ